MMKSLHLKLSIVFCALLFLAFATATFANHAWGKYHWNLSTAQTEIAPLKIGDNLNTAEWKSSLALASQDWNPSVLKNQVVEGTSNANCDPTLGQVEVCNSAYGTNGWLGIAQVWAYRGKDAHIAQAVVKLNDTYFNTPQYNTEPWRNLVTCQEIGHTFGLDHQDENFTNANLGTCMDYTNDPDGTLFVQANNEHPNQHDYDMLEEIYAHVNSSTGGGGPGKGGGKKPVSIGKNIDLDDPSAWGKAVKQDAQGNGSLYVRDLGNGFEIVTHVTWVLEEQDTENAHGE